jgi:hypothetical protein
MQDRLLAVAARLSDADLLRRVVVLAGREREATVELVAHLAELDARRLYRGEGFGSLFSYCTGALRLAEHAAYNRIEAARASRRVPAILDLLADGSLNLSTVRLLAPHIRPDNLESLVSMAKGKSKRDVEALVARLAPRPDVAASVRRLPAPVALAAVPPPVSLGAPQPAVPTAAASATREAFTDEPATTPAASLDSAPAWAMSAPERPARRAVVPPLAPERYGQFTIGEDHGCAGPSPARDPRWRSRCDLRPGAHTPARGRGPEEGGPDLAAADRRSCGDPFAPHPGAREARRVAA